MECDTSYGYFHTSVKIRGRRSAIISLKVIEGWIEGGYGVKQWVFKNLYDIFRKPTVERPYIDNVVFFSLLEYNNLV